MGLVREIARPPNLATLVSEVVMVRHFLTRCSLAPAMGRGIVYPKPRQLVIAGGVSLSPLAPRNALLRLVQSPRSMSADKLAGQVERPIRPTSPSYLPGCAGSYPLVASVRPAPLAAGRERADGERGGSINARQRSPLIAVQPGTLCLTDCSGIPHRTALVHGFERSCLAQKTLFVR